MVADTVDLVARMRWHFRCGGEEGGSAQLRLAVIDGSNTEDVGSSLRKKKLPSGYAVYYTMAALILSTSVSTASRSICWINEITPTARGLCSCCRYSGRLRW